MFDEKTKLLAEIAESEQRHTQHVAKRLDGIARLASHPGRDRKTALTKLAKTSGWTKAIARREIAFAVALTTRLPATFAAMRAGALNEQKVRRIAAATEALSDELAARVDAEVGAPAAQLQWDQFEELLRDAVARADPGAAPDSAGRPKGRRVIHKDLGDGTGSLAFYGDAERVVLASQRIRAIAWRLKAAGDSRTLDQITSDVTLDLLTGTGQSMESR